MGQTLTNGIYLPAEGERNCYEGLAANWTALDGLVGGYNVHISNTTIHVTAEDKQAWDGHVADSVKHVTAADKQAWDGHVADTTIHVTAADKQAWDGHVADTTIHVTSADKQAWDGHVADTTIHVTSADKQAWNSKADNSALTAHTGDTTIHVTSADKQAWDGHVADSVKHVTAEDKAKWDAVTSKADDSDVVHKSGNETVSGEKTFGDVSTFYGSYIGNETSTNARTVQILESNRDTHGRSGLYITKFRQNKAQGELSGNDVVYLTLDLLENSVRTNAIFRFNFKNFVDNVPQDIAFYPTGLKNSLGGSAGGSNNKWHFINGINPGALSLPNLNNGIDISGYLDVYRSSINTYTPPSDGYISILGRGSVTNAIVIKTGSLIASMGQSVLDFNSTDRVSFCLCPVFKNQTVTIWLKSVTSLDSAKFYPCLGNV